MKDQYFGDINDYAKYALLRRVARREGLRMTVCWMLTARDRSSDGRFVDYLDVPDRFAGLDPELFRFLAGALAAGQRHVTAIESSGLLGEVTFHRELLTDDLAWRDEFFRRLWTLAALSDVIFFDPDNGLSVPSVARGRRNSHKYLYWDELATSTVRGQSAIVYQHFPRVGRASFVRTTVSRIQAELGSAAFAVYTSKVAFLAVARPEHELRLRRAMREASEHSGGLLHYAP